MSTQRAAKRSRLHEDDRSRIRHMGQASTCLFSQSAPRFFATALAHALHRFLASAHVSKRPSTSGYSVRLELQSGFPPTPETCNTFFRRLSRHTLHAMHGLFVLEWVILNNQYTPEFARRRSGR
jgi:hypothetical protein